MEQTPSLSVTSTCPQLGLKNDRAVCFSYPSTGNYCYQLPLPVVPRLAHQERYCLTVGHLNCPARMNAAHVRDFPFEFQADRDRMVRRARSTARILALLIGMIGVILAALWGSGLTGPFLAPPTRTPQQTATAWVRPSATQPPPTNSPVPTSTRTSTATPFSQIHALEVPIVVGDRTFLIHRVEWGDTFESIAAAFSTSPAVIQALNHSLKPPLKANSLIVISPGLQEVDPTLPSFDIYQVTKGETTIEELARELNVDPESLRLYNACNDNCRLFPGDWLIIPIYAA